MKTLNKRHGAETPKNKNAVNRHNRLSSAREALEKLKSREKIPESDRGSMALNLGKMIVVAQKKDQTLTFSRLFKEAFGEARGVSFFKKKDRLICMPGQKLGKTHYVMGLHYLELLKALIKYIELPEGQSSEGQFSVAVMRLIEGTSYDYKGGYADRAKVEYKKELDKQFERLVETVSREVNLDWMREWTQDHPIFVKGPTGVVIDMELQSDGFTRNPGTFDMSGSMENCLAPYVRIACLYDDIKVSDYLYVEIKKNVSNVSVHDIQEAVSHLVGKDLAEYDEDSRAEQLDALVHHKGWQKSTDNQRFASVRVKMLIDIELRYDEDLAKWRPLVLLRCPRLDGTTWDFRNSYFSSPTPSPLIVGSRGTTLYSMFDWVSVYEIFCLGSDYTRVYAVEDRASEKATTYKIFLDENHSHLGLQLFGSPFLGAQLEECFCPTESQFYDFMLTPFERENDGRDLIFEIGRGQIDPALTGFVKAPANTIAYEILQNMAYAPERKRIDQLLLNDAKEKYKKLKKFSEIAEREYEQAIGRL